MQVTIIQQKIFMKNIFLLIILIFILSDCVNKIDTKINKKDDVLN